MDHPEEFWLRSLLHGLDEEQNCSRWDIVEEGAEVMQDLPFQIEAIGAVVEMKANDKHLEPSFVKKWLEERRQEGKPEILELFRVGPRGEDEPHEAGRYAIELADIATGGLEQEEEIVEFSRWPTQQILFINYVAQDQRNILRSDFIFWVNDRTYKK